MSFATYKSPFDEALSKPLITEENHNHDTEGVTSKRKNQSDSSRKSNINSNSGSEGSSNRVSSSSNNSNAKSNTAVYSTKLPFQQTINNNIKRDNNFFSYLYKSSDNSEKDNDEEKSNYQPPNSTLESQQQLQVREGNQQTSLEFALLQERNEESRTILKNMNTISAITSELNSLVQSQQEIIDEVEETAVNVHDYTEKGLRSLQDADQLLSNNNGSGVQVFWKYFFGVIAVGGFIIALIIFLHSM